jgi:hypothetical protein
VIGSFIKVHIGGNEIEVLSGLLDGVFKRGLAFDYMG